MDLDLHVCKDGRLRACLPRGGRMVALEAVRKAFSRELDDLEFWSRLFESRIFFEDGLTVGGFLKSLRPWQDFFGKLIGKDVAAFIKEACSPRDASALEEDFKLDWVSIEKTCSFDPGFEYEHDAEMDLEEWLNSSKRMRLTGDWEVESYYSMSGFRKGMPESYAIDHSPMSELANVPIYLDSKMIISVDSSRHVEKTLGSSCVPFGDSSYGMRESHEGGRSVRYFRGNVAHKALDVIQGFFWWMPANPQARDRFNEMLKESIGSLDESLEEAASQESKEDSEGMKVSVAPGAFSGLAESARRLEEFWKAACSLDDEAVAKMGFPRQIDPPERRICGMPTDERDLGTPFLPI